MQVLKNPPSDWRALVLNADFRPLSYYPLSTKPWQEVVKAVFEDRVDVVSTYDVEIHSPSMMMRLPSGGVAEDLYRPEPAAGLYPVQCLPARPLSLPVLRRASTT